MYGDGGGDGGGGAITSNAWAAVRIRLSHLDASIHTLTCGTFISRRVYVPTVTLVP